MSTKRTLGSISSELLSKHSGSISPIDVQKAQEQEYLDNLIWCVEHAMKKVSCVGMKDHDDCKDRDALDGDFFVSVILKKEKILSNVMRNYFVPTKVCPTPCYDQTLYRFDSKKESIEFVWVIPDRDTCETFRDNYMVIVPAEQGLLRQVLDFYDGTLFRLCKKFNGEIMARGGALEGSQYV